MDASDHDGHGMGMRRGASAAFATFEGTLSAALVGSRSDDRSREHGDKNGALPVLLWFGSESPISLHFRLSRLPRQEFLDELERGTTGICKFCEQSGCTECTVLG
jgi:hypothetical protein